MKHLHLLLGTSLVFIGILGMLTQESSQISIAASTSIGITNILIALGDNK